MKRAKPSLVLCCALLLLLIGEVQAQTKIINGIAGKSSGSLPIFIAQEKGLYRAEGLEMDTPTMPPPASIAALLAGELQIGHGEGAMRGAMKGAPIKAFIFFYDRPTFTFLARPEIGSVRDLRGKSIAILSHGDSNSVYTRKIMRAHGVMDNDYTLVPMGADPQRLLGMVKGLVHASLLNPETTVRAESQLEGVKRLASIADMPRTPYNGFAATNKLLSENPQIIKKFLRASLKAMLLTRDQPQEAARVLAKTVGLEERFAVATVRILVEAINPKDPGGFTEASLQDWISENASYVGQKAEEIKITDLVDLTLLREAQRDMGIFCEGGYGCK